MKNCTHCKYAKWERTNSGRLHPSGDGRCTYVVKMPRLPACMYWSTYSKAPEPSGGFINRRQDLSEDCPTYQRAEQ